MVVDGPRRMLVLAGLALVVLGSSLPALLGSWVYDDRLMIGHPMLDGLEDVGPAFRRSSDDYQSRDRTGPFIAQGTTYRPLPMISFILINGTIGIVPFPHHVVSLLLHLAAVLLLGRLAKSWAALAGVAVFALHPAIGEAYLWINGRADVLAGALLAGTLVVLSGAPSWRRQAALFALLVAAALSKETFVVAAAFAIAAASVGRSWRAMGREFLVLVAAFAAAFALRATAGGTVASTLPSVSIVDVFARAPRLLALAVETLVVPFPRAMRFLAWELDRPLDAPAILASLLPLLLLAFLLIRRNLRAAILVCGALVTLLPTALVGDSFWLGFDRYLYLPALLLVAAALPWLERRRWGVWSLLPAGLLVVTTFGEARAYRSHGDFAQAILNARPDDPAGYLVAARDAIDRGDRASAAALLGAVPDAARIPVVAHHGAEIYLAIGDPRSAADLVERAAAEHPESANLRYDLFVLRGSQRRWDEAAALARELSKDPARRRAVTDTIDAWLAAGVVPPDVRDRLALQRSGN